VKRREFIALLGSTAAAWPLTSRAQQRERVRRIGMLLNLRETASRGKASVAAFVQRLNELGWSEGRNLQLDIRWGGDDTDRYRQYGRELVALFPDVVIGVSSAVVSTLQQVTRTMPIVFVNVVDPLGAGLIESMARPGGNATGFIVFEYAIGAKWLELLKEISPGVTRAAVLRDPTIAAGIGQFAAIQAVVPLGIELSVISLQDPGAIEPAVATFARGSNGGLVMTASPFGPNNASAIPGLAARYRLPAVYPFRYHVEAGGLVSYGPDIVGQFRPAADYVDRILKGENPAELPVQAPTKYELVINMKTAQALGITIPATLLARADEVIE